MLDLISWFQLFQLFHIFLSSHLGSQDSKDGLSVSGGGTEDRKPPPVPEESGKSKVASWLTSQSDSAGGENVKVEGGTKTEKKVQIEIQTLSEGLGFFWKGPGFPPYFCSLIQLLAR